LVAYVFSHRPAEGVDIAAYEGSLRRFHTELEKAGLSGFIESATFSIGAVYSDWYLLENTAAMEVLNAAAVSGARASAHDSAARMSADGAGKLLSLAAGKASMDEGFEVRFGKPAGMPYDDLYARLEAWTNAQGVSLWRRMMVLGPPPEFCLITPSNVDLPPEMHPEALRRTRI
jgi:hypothetical protein